MPKAEFLCDPQIIVSFQNSAGKYLPSKSSLVSGISWPFLYVCDNSISLSHINRLACRLISVKLYASAMEMISTQLSPVSCDFRNSQHASSMVALFKVTAVLSTVSTSCMVMAIRAMYAKSMKSWNPGTLTLMRSMLCLALTAWVVKISCKDKTVCLDTYYSNNKVYCHLIFSLQWTETNPMCRIHTWKTHYQSIDKGVILQFFDFSNLTLVPP